MNTQTWVFTLFGTVIIGIISWLFNRAVAGVDGKVNGACEKMDKAVEAVQEMRLEMTGYKELVSYLRTDVVELKGENKSLRESHAVIDKYIAVQQALHPHGPRNSSH